MRLKSVQISDYKCIRKPCGFDVSDITCLVGKNESGKTTILEALHRLNPIIPKHGAFNVDNDFPRIDVEDYHIEVKDDQREPAIVTRATFSLEREDLDKIEADFPGVLADRELTLSKGYSNELYAELIINEELAVESLLSKARLPSQLLKSLTKCTTLEELASSLHTDEKNDAVSRLLELISQIQEKGLLNYLYEKYFEHKVPKFLYFDEFYQMKGHVNIQALQQRQQNHQLLDSDYPLLGLIELARLNLDEISNPERTLQRDNRLEGASNHLTRNIMKYWSQNRYLEMRFDIRPALPDDPEGMQTGTNLWGHVYNSKQRVSTLLGRRSKGFIWFFSFLAWFSQHKRKNIPLILLLDEPDLFLHGTAQRDLLRYLEDELKAGHQVIYTTQSPYMVDPNRFDRIRIVEDKSQEIEDLSSSVREGTQVYTDVLEVNNESTLPLKGALGYQILKSLFSSQNVLVVEAIADLLFLQTMSILLHNEGYVGLEARWTITPIGGAQELPVFVSLAGYSQNMKIVSLLQIQENKESISDLYHKNLLKKENVLSYADFTSSTEADIEDLFDLDFYLVLINAAYKEDLRKPLTKGHLRGRSPRVVELVAQHFETLADTKKPTFDRYRPARYFAENSPSLIEKLSKETYTRFEQLFKTINTH